VSQSDSLGDLALHVRGLPHQNRPCPYRIDIELTPQLTARIPRTGTGVGGEVGISEFQVVGPQSRDGSLRLDIAITSAVMATTPRRVAILAMVAPGFRLGLAGSRHQRDYGYHAPLRRHLGHGRAHRCEQCGTVYLSTLIELGWSADEAITEVRRVRQGAIERPAQEAAARSWGGVITMSKSPTIYGAARSLEALEEAGLGDSQSAQAFRLTLQRKKERNGKPPEGQDERMMVASLKQAPEG
jgi:hypothetical protein